MTVSWKRLPLIALCLAAPLFVGCGGGGGSTAGTNNQASDPTRGTLAVKMTFPAALNFQSKAAHRAASGYQGNIPVGTLSVRINVIDPTTGTQLATKLATGPVTNNGLPSVITVDFAYLPAGPVRVQAFAYPDVAGLQNPLATGSTDGVIVALSTTTVNVPLTLTAVSIATNPSVRTTISASPAANSTLTITATVADSAGRPLAYPLIWVSSDPLIASIAYDPNNSGTATVTGLLPGTTTISVVEVNSGLTATVPVTVQTGP